MDLKFYVCFNFIIYSFIGWIIEEVYSFFIDGSFKKEGFLIGPLKPMYGIALTLLVIYHEILNFDVMPMILLCFLIPTTVEYISGYLLKHIFNKVYWDYSHLKLNINGFVTLKFSIYWTILSMIGIYYLQPIVRSLYVKEEHFFSALTIVVFIGFLIDLFVTTKKLYLLLTLRNRKLE